MNDKKLAEKILHLLYPYRRELTVNKNCQHDHLIDCIDIHLHKIINLIKNKRPLEFVLPAFPAKSPNKNKTIAPFPDLGERLSLRFLDDLCKKIMLHYSPGAQITICSDGRVFNDLIKVSNEHVDLYARGIDNLIREDSLTALKTFGLDQHYSSISYEAMRTQLLGDYGQPISVIKNKLHSSYSEKMLFNGIHRFIFEDELALSNLLSKNQIRKIAKDTTYRVIQRSNAWSQLIEKQFPDAIRLSIHPQSCGSKKLGIMLLKSKDQWATPWHRVVLFDGNEHVLIRKNEADALCARPILINKQFSHYII